MPVAPGTRLGPYEVIALLGAGGMGEVYRARDTRLDRSVAVKVLAPGLVATPEARARFEREARAVAALQHPHICVLHDIGRDHDTDYLVMEHLEGETLAARLRRGPLPLAELVRAGAEIAGALAFAHRAGIVHRDLKPGNIMLTPQGAKLLDFGLAKAAGAPEAAATPSFTATLAATALQSPMTQAGTLIGTVQYMSPEQIEGRPADARSDIFALGCVLYECATAQPAFAGASNLSLAAAILEKQPAPLRGLQPLAPAGLERLIAACLRKAPDQRWQSAADVATALAWAGDETAPAAPPPRRWLASGLGAALALALLALAWRGFAPEPAALRTVTEIPPPPGNAYSFSGSTPGPPMLSPDGHQIAFVAHTPSGSDALWLRPLDQLQAHMLPGTQNAMLPFWAPDAHAIAYFTHADVLGFGQLMVFDLASGEAHPLAEVRMARGGSWSPDGSTILYSPGVNQGLFRIPARGGTPVAVTRLDPSISSHRYPFFLPDGQHFLYLAVNHEDAARDMLYFASLDGTVNLPLAHSLSGAVFASGQMLYSIAGSLTAQTLDPATGILGTGLRTVARQVDDDPVSWRPGYSVSRTGGLAYVTGSPGAEQLAWVDRRGQPATLLPAFAGTALTAALAPGGNRLALSVDDGLQDIWVVDRAGQGRMRLTHGPVANLGPVWSPDGATVIYGANLHDHMRPFRRAANGSGTAVALAPGLPAGLHLLPSAVSPDGRQLLCVLVSEAAQYSLNTLALPTGRLGTPLVPAAPNVIENVSLAPGGRWVAYLAAPSDQPLSLYVVPFAGDHGPVQVTTQGVINYFWAANGQELDFAAADGTLNAVAVTATAGAPSFGAPHQVAAHFPAFLTASPDGKSILATTFPDDHQRLVVVSNWNAAH